MCLAIMESLTATVNKVVVHSVLCSTMTARANDVYYLAPYAFFALTQSRQLGFAETFPCVRLHDDFFSLFCTQCTCAINVCKWMNVWYGLAQQTLSLSLQRGAERNKKGVERKKDDFVFVWGQCLLEGNDTIVSIHSHTNNIMTFCSCDWTSCIHPNRQYHNGISEQFLLVVK